MRGLHTAATCCHVKPSVHIVLQTASLLQAAELAAKLKQHRMTGAHVNLIPWNPVADSSFESPGNNALDRFRKVLDQAGIGATVRMPRGLDASAACGQLRNEHQKMALPEFAPLQ